MIYLESVTPDNWRLGLAVAEEQRRYVSDSAGILARAYAYRNSRSCAYIIYADATPVGMALYYDCDALGAFNFSQMFIDRRHQGKGYGAEAARQMLKLMEQDGKYDKVVLCFIEGNDAARCMYEKLGFSLTGERDGDELIMEKYLR